MARSKQTADKATDVDLTPFLNILVTIIPVLLSTAVFSKMAIIQLNLPTLAGAGAAAAAAEGENINIEVQLHVDGIAVYDGKKIVASFPNVKVEGATSVDENEAGYQFDQLNEYLKGVKANYPDKQDATILIDPYIKYSYVISVFDAVILYREGNDVDLRNEPLFPAIAIGDTPLGGFKGK